MLKLKSNILFILMFAVVSCDNNDDDKNSIETGRNYFPVYVGMERIYSIDSLAYDNNAGFTQIDTFRYLYKEVITERTQNGAGEEIFIVSRFYADTLNGAWRTANRWIWQHAQQHFIVTEENRPIAKAAFPLELNKNWNGNLFNNQPTQRFRVTAIRQPFGNFENTLLVQQQNDSNLIELMRRTERYAHNIGLVLLRHDSLNTQVAGTRGFRKTQTLIQSR